MKLEPFSVALPGQEQVPDEPDVNGLPVWKKTDGGWACGDWDTQAFAVRCLLEGFNLPAFDKWLQGVEGDIKEELLERRALAKADDEFLRHVEFMYLTAWYLPLLQKAAPRLESRRASDAGLAKGRDAAAKQNRKIDAEEFDRREKESKNDKHLAKLLQVHPSSVSRHRKATGKRRPKTS